MTLEESKQLEVKIANNILNNVPFAQVVQILSGEATRRAKEVVDNASAEELTKMKEDFEKAEAEAQAAQNQQQDKIDLPDETAEKKD
ncbi:MAG TPA: hypothetical protein DCE27_10270 [Xanthomarina gelatinilytica]|jgi:hypothetical protein|nr:hypothetical protein [Xanthomarina gelatinilytica]|tara:strand:- start:139 stop:399 length:261 start_codon:yes stop_codon:yes gene_type:complete